MSVADAMIAEFNQEAAGSRKVLERLPEDKYDWKPHEKSFTAGRLACHIAEIPEWAKTTVQDDLFDMDAVDYKPPVFDTRTALLEYFDKNVEAFSEVLKGQSDEHLLTHWKMKYGGEVALDLPRVACLRSFVLNHAVHHRAQLTVYLRLLEIPVPGLYGPSADEGM